MQVTVPDPSLAPPPSFRIVPRGLLVILLLVAAVYMPSAWNGFVWDDWELVVGIDAYQAFDLGAILSGKASSLEYLPVRDLSLAVDALLWGMRPAGFHVTNVLLYLLSLAVLYVLVRSLAASLGESEGDRLAFWSTLCFALHPLHAESVNFIAARNTLLAGLFLFLSSAAFLRGVHGRRNGALALSLGLFALAMLSKAVAVFFPVFLAAVLSRVPPAVLSWRRRLIILGMFTAVAAAGALLHRSVAAEAAIVNEEFLRFGVQSWQTKVLQAVQIPVFYLRMFVLPYPLSVQYPVAVGRGTIDAGVVSAALLMAAIVAAAWYGRSRAPLAAMGALWFLASLLPVMNWFPTHPVVADRYAYFAVAGLGLLAGTAVVRGSRIWPRAAQIAGILALLGAAVSAARTLEWRSDITLWRSAIAADPGAPRIQLAQALWREGKEDEAISILAEERTRKGTHYASLYEGKRYLQQGAVDAALQSFQRSLAEGGDAFREVQYHAARTYELKGDAERALAHYLKAREARDVDVNQRLARDAEAGVNRMRAALAPRMASLRARAESAPGDLQAVTAYAGVLYSAGLYAEAEHAYRRVLEQGPERWEVWYNLALVQMRTRSYRAAQGSFERALALHEDKNLLNNLGVASLHLKDFAKAEAAYRRALALDPGFFYAAFNLGRLHFVQGARVPARQAFLAAREMVAGDPALLHRIDQYLEQIP